MIKINDLFNYGSKQVFSPHEQKILMNNNSQQELTEEQGKKILEYSVKTMKMIELSQKSQQQKMQNKVQ